ncbi:MAG: 4Fe-4S dicluster domain-containing protein [Helicobacteraceae bacterium]|nr:4Fe-4S dicluster domain-containing protein [Helicobacteraceae bacterium]
MKSAQRILRKIRTDHIWANPRNCTACWRCIRACPKRVIGKRAFLWHRHIYIKDADSCTGCEGCIKVCPSGVFSRTLTDSLEKILSRRGFNISDITGRAL